MSRKVLVDVTEEDIFCYNIAKSNSGYANIVNDNMLSAALRPALDIKDWEILVLRDRLCIQRYNPEIKNLEFLYSNPLYFCSELVERLRLHDCEEFLKIEPFTLEIEFCEDKSPSLEPYKNKEFGRIKVVR